MAGKQELLLPLSVWHCYCCCCCCYLLQFCSFLFAPPGFFSASLFGFLSPGYRTELNFTSLWAASSSAAFPAYATYSSEGFPVSRFPFPFSFFTKVSVIFSTRAAKHDTRQKGIFLLLLASCVCLWLLMLPVCCFSFCLSFLLFLPLSTLSPCLFAAVLGANCTFVGTNAMETMPPATAHKYYGRWHYGCLLSISLNFSLFQVISAKATSQVLCVCRRLIVCLPLTV